MKIIQFWHGCVSDEIATLTATWKDLNNSHEYLIFDSISAKEFMRSNYTEDVYRAFCKINIPAMMSDVFRIAVMLHYGGVYIDCASRCLKPVDDWGMDFESLTLLRKWHGGIWNGFISAPAGHSCLRDIWDRIEKVLTDRTDGSIWVLTGPKLFNDIEKDLILSDSYAPHEIYEGGSAQSGVVIINQTQFSSNFSLINNLRHKKGAHWSKLEQVIPLFGRLDDNIPIGDVLEKRMVFHLGLTKFDSIAWRSALEVNRDAEVLHLPFERMTHHSRNNLSCDIDNRSNFQIDDILQSSIESKKNIIVVSCEVGDFTRNNIFSKSLFVGFMESLSDLAKRFKSSDVLYTVQDQKQVLADAVISDPDFIVQSDCYKAGSLSAHPLFDYCVLDEALEKFFPCSTLTPFLYTRGQKLNVTFEGSELGGGVLVSSEDPLLHEAPYAKNVHDYYAASNEIFVDKYPKMKIPNIYNSEPSELGIAGRALDDMKSPIILLGMHRSGTSALAGTLEELGVYLGDTNHSSIDNLKGNRELRSVMVLHDDLLERNSGSWDRPIANARWGSIHNELRDSIIKQFKGRPKWGFKDPRTLLVLNGWLKVVPDSTLVGVFRHPFLVAESLRIRNDIPYERGLKIWMFYNRILFWHYNNNGPFPIVEFCSSKELFDKQIVSLAGKLGFCHTDAIFFDASMQQEFVPNLRMCEGGVEVLELYRRLRSISTLH